MVTSGLKVSRLFFVVVLVLSLVLPFSLLPAYSASYSSITDLSNDANDSEFAELFAAGSNVYVVWSDDTANEIRFTNSTDAGSSFWSHEKIGDIDTGGTQSDKPAPQIVANGDNVYIAWQDNQRIKFIKSTNNGNTFSTEKIIGNATNTSLTTELTLLNSTSNDAYLSWVNVTSTATDKVYFVNTTDGTTFDDTDSSNDIVDAFDVGSSGGSGGQQKVVKMAVSGNNIYLVWVDGANLKFRHSNDNGDTFESVQDEFASLGTTVDTVEPDIAANGSNVYVVWRDISGSFPNLTGDVNFIRNTNSGDKDSWSSKAKIGSGSSSTTADLTPKIAIGSGSNLYVVWNESTGDKEIKIAHSDSTSPGQEFLDDAHTTTTLSSSGSGKTTTQPQIATLDDNVFVVWREDTDSNDKDIKAVVSINNGTSFTNPQDFSQLTGGNPSFLSTLPQLYASGSKAYAVWQEHDNSGGTLPDIKFVSISPTASPIFNQTNYKLSDGAKITLTDSDLNTSDSSKQEYDINVKSDTDTSGITLTIKETTNTSGVFEGIITFSTSSSSGTVLKASAGDTITATFSSSIGTANIHSRTVAFDSDDYIVGEIARVIVTDKNSDTDDKGSTDSVKVTLSARDSDFSSSITLQETSTAGTFGTTSDHDIIIMKDDLRIPLDRTLTITETKSGDSPDVNNPDTRTMTISSPTSASDLSLTITETGANTNKYSGEFGVSTSATGGTNLQVSTCDIIKILDSASGESARGLITPCSDTDKAVLIVDVPTTTDTDRITASFGGSSDTETVFFDNSKGGGGGGGLVRPTVVLNAIAGAKAIFGGGSSDASPPASTLDIIAESETIDMPDHIKEIVENYDPQIPLEPIVDDSFDFPLEINDNGYPLSSNENKIVTDKVEVGEPVQFKMTFYEQRDLWHVSVYLNIRDGMRDDQSDTFILFDKDEPLTIKDKNGFFENVDFEIIEDENNKKFAIFDITFAKPMETSDFVYKAWDFDRQGTVVKVKDAIKVGEIPEPEPVEPPEPEPVEIKEKPVPDWVKNTAKWWADDQIDDQTFTNGIGFLISENIIDVPVEPNVGEVKEDEPGIEPEEEPQVKVPEWVKNTAQWWADDQIDQETFLSAIEFLVKKDIIVVVPG